MPIVNNSETISSLLRNGVPSIRYAVDTTMNTKALFRQSNKIRW